MRYVAVVIEIIPPPVPTEVTNADIPVAVVNTAVVADVGPPVSAMKAVAAVVVAPVGRRPKRTIVWGRAPGSGNPVVSTVAPGPVAGSPDVVVVGSRRLVVFRQRRRSFVRVFDGLLACVFVALILAVVAADDGGWCLPLIITLRWLRLLVGLTLLLRGIGGVGSKNLCAIGGWSEIAVCRVRAAVGDGGRGAVVNGGGVSGVVGTALAPGHSEGKQRCCA